MFVFGWVTPTIFYKREKILHYSVHRQYETLYTSGLLSGRDLLGVSVVNVVWMDESRPCCTRDDSESFSSVVIDHLWWKRQTIQERQREYRYLCCCWDGCVLWKMSPIFTSVTSVRRKNHWQSVLRVSSVRRLFYLPSLVTHEQNFGWSILIPILLYSLPPV